MTSPAQSSSILFFASTIKTLAVPKHNSASLTLLSFCYSLDMWSCDHLPLVSYDLPNSSVVILLLFRHHIWSPIVLSRAGQPTPENIRVWDLTRPGSDRKRILPAGLGSANRKAGITCWWVKSASTLIVYYFFLNHSASSPRSKTVLWPVLTSSFSEFTAYLLTLLSRLSAEQIPFSSPKTACFLITRRGEGQGFEKCLSLSPCAPRCFLVPLLRGMIIRHHRLPLFL